MNALPLKPSAKPAEVIDDLVQSFGLRPVLLAVLSRLFRRTRPPDSASFPKLALQRNLGELDDHLRQDLGLPPKEETVKIEPIMLVRSGYM